MDIVYSNINVIQLNQDNKYEIHYKEDIDNRMANKTIPMIYQSKITNIEVEVYNYKAYDNNNKKPNKYID